MKMLFRCALLIVCSLCLSACGKSPLEKDLEAYVRVNKDIYEQAEKAKATMAVRTSTAEYLGASTKRDAFMDFLEVNKRILDDLKPQDQQMLEQVNLLRTGYGDWAKFLRELDNAQGKRERDEQLEQEIRADVDKAEAQVTKAQNAIIALGQSEGVKIEQPFTMCAEDEANCN